MNIRNRTRNAFTLIEILIVVVILGILAAVVIPQFSNAADSANEATVKTQLQTLRSQIELYRAETGTDPALNAANGWSDMITGGYLPGPPKNPIAGESSFGSAATDGWQFANLQLDASQNWVAGPAGGSNVLVANKADGSIFNDYSDTP